MSKSIGINLFTFYFFFADARDKLAKIAKGTDARQKLEKIRNLKEGKFDVKKTKKGGITIVTTTQGTV